LFPLKNSHESICIYLQCYTHTYIYTLMDGCV
jgi:hypothetical protein